MTYSNNSKEYVPMSDESSTKVGTLLHILDLAVQWPQLRALHDLAMADLMVLNEAAAVELKDRAEKAAAEAEANQPKAIPSEDNPTDTVVERRV